MISILASLFLEHTVYIYANVLLLLDAAVINFVICFLHPQQQQRQQPLHAGNSNSEKWEFTAGKPAAQVSVDEPAIYLSVFRRLDLRWKRGRLIRCLHARTGIAYMYAIQVRASKHRIRVFILLWASNIQIRNITGICTATMANTLCGRHSNFNLYAHQYIQVRAT